MSHRRVGIAALIASGWLVLANLTHPIGSTEVFTDGVAFVEHTNTYWVISHLLIGLAFLVAPWLAWSWRDRLTSVEGRTWGTFALILVGVGSAFGVFHVSGIDGVGIPAYRDVLASGGDSAAVGADLFMKIHLASITTWAIILWGAAQTALGVAELVEGTRRLLGWLLVVCGLLGFAFAGTIALQGHLTRFSEGVLFRGSTVGFTVWLIWTAWQSYKSVEPVGQPS